ncbi:MAG TPA: response regulator [Desulfopila sp.]|nr:response regulator [Desulfopila sp.]
MEIFAHTKEKQDRALILIQGEDEIVKRIQEPIFIVDDDQGILESFDVMLGDDYKLVMASDGNLALQLLNRHKPDLLFLDLQIPGPDGLEVLTHIRQKGLMTRVVIVTAMVQEEYQKRAEQLGVYRYLNKPLDVDEIMEIAHTATHSLQ